MEELGLAALFIGPYGRVGPGSLVAWSVLKSWAWQPVYSIRMNRPAILEGRRRSFRKTSCGAERDGEERIFFIFNIIFNQNYVLIL